MPWTLGSQRFPTNNGILEVTEEVKPLIKKPIGFADFHLLQSLSS
jgi:hypothetical protein